MATQIEFTYQDINYTLEYTRATVVALEDAGFKMKDLVDKPMKTAPMLFAGAFKAHHPYTKPSLINEILESLPDKEGLYETLVAMVEEPLTTLTAEPVEEKKVNWKVVK